MPERNEHEENGDLLALTSISWEHRESADYSLDSMEREFRELLRQVEDTTRESRVQRNAH
jgi:hypothetical protein